MVQNKAEVVINRNADTISVTILVTIDLLLSLLILKYAVTVPDPINPTIGADISPIQIHINTYAFRAGIVIKSVAMYLIAFVTARRIRHSGQPPG